MKSTSALEERYRRRAELLLKAAKWPAIGALIGGGALLVGRLLGPAVVKELGANAGHGFAHGVAEAQETIAQIRRKLSISGWGGTGDFAVLAQLRRMPGLVSHGVVLQNLEAPRDQQVCAYEVRWLRGQPLPSLPPRLEGYPTKLVIVDAYPVAQHR